MASVYDVIVVGGGHNGLVSASYLAKAGKKVLLLEGAAELGGATALSGFTGVAAGVGGIKPKAKGVAPAIQISPAASTAAAVAMDAAD